MTTGTKSDPWALTTAPGRSSYTMYRDEQSDPPAFVCQVGSTTLKHHLRAVEDLHAWLTAQSDWVPLGSACTCRLCWRHSNWSSSPVDARNNRVRALRNAPIPTTSGAPR
jgi:hypothetical protein